ALSRGSRCAPGRHLIARRSWDRSTPPRRLLLYRQLRLRSKPGEDSSSLYPTWRRCPQNSLCPSNSAGKAGTSSPYIRNFGTRVRSAEGPRRLLIGSAREGKKYARHSTSSLSPGTSRKACLIVRSDTWSPARPTESANHTSYVAHADR